MNHAKSPYISCLLLTACISLTACSKKEDASPDTETNASNDEVIMDVTVIKETVSFESDNDDEETAENEAETDATPEDSEQTDTATEATDEAVTRDKAAATDADSTQQEALSSNNGSSIAYSLHSVHAHKAIQTISAIDYQNNSVTLERANGEEKTVKLDNLNIDIQSINIGDVYESEFKQHIVIKAINSDAEMDVSEDDNDPITDGEKTVMKRVVNTEQQTATVNAIDTSAQQITLGFSDGSTADFHIHQGSNNGELNTGDAVEITLEDILLIELVKSAK